MDHGRIGARIGRRTQNPDFEMWEFAISSYPTSYLTHNLPEYFAVDNARMCAFVCPDVPFSIATTTPSQGPPFAWFLNAFVVGLTRGTCLLIVV